MEDQKDDLETFREQWRRELGRQPSDENTGGKDSVDDNQEDEEDDVHVQARALFLQGVQFEESGKLYEAIRFYKRAEKLVPNIELQTFAYTRRNMTKDVVEKNPRVTIPDKASEVVEEDNEDEVSNLVAKFARLKTGSEYSGPMVQPDYEANMTHIGTLPSEVLNYILKWVVSSELDLASLERFSEVCRGFYLAARDDEIWRLVCAKTWGPTSISSISSNIYPTWREMYLVRPRVSYSGCYVSKQSYIREGERGFQDHESHRAWHFVEYYRFIRFFPDGKVAMVMSADDQDLVAKQMNTLKGCSNMQGVLLGDYKIVDNVLVTVLHKVKEKKKAQPLRYRKKKNKDAMVYHEVPEQDFHLEFYIKGDFWQNLIWKDYNIVSKYKNGNERTDSLNIKNQNNYPKLTFRWVESYHFESNSPLQ